MNRFYRYLGKPVLVYPSHPIDELPYAYLILQKGMVAEEIKNGDFMDLQIKVSAGVRLENEPVSKDWEQVDIPND